MMPNQKKEKEMATYSLDLRARIMGSIAGGMRITDAAKTFNVSRRVIYKWIDLEKETGSLAPKSGYQKGHSHKITDLAKFEIFALAHGHLTVKGMMAEWEKQHNVSVSETRMAVYLEKIGFTSKKNFSLRRS